MKAQFRNLILQSLDADSAALISPHLARVSLTGGQRIGASASAIQRVCFPETFVASFAEVLDDDIRVEVGVIGREGIIGWPVLLGSAHAAHSGIVQLQGGDGLVIDADILVALCHANPQLHRALLLFVQSFTVQMGRTIVANLRDPLDRRLSRWLAMLHDRIDGDTLPVTHACLAVALNVRRASITDTLHILEGNRVLRCTRGSITIRDRAALEVVAGAAYGPAEAAYSQLVAPFGKVATPVADTPRHHPDVARFAQHYVHG